MEIVTFYRKSGYSAKGKVAGMIGVEVEFYIVRRVTDRWPGLFGHAESICNFNGLKVLLAAYRVEQNHVSHQRNSILYEKSFIILQIG